MTSADESARRAQEDADWQRLVESYGERPDFPQPPTPAEPADVVEPDPEPELVENDEDHFVPPPPPPVPRPQGVRGLAWFGLFGVPVLVLLSIVGHIALPTPIPFGLLVWFVGGFGYLVATMGAGDDDSGWDDGAVL